MSRRRRRKAHRSRRSFRHGFQTDSRLRSLASTDSTLELVTYELTDEPMEDRRYPLIGPEDEALVEEICSQLWEKGASFVGPLEALVQKYPDIPRLYNYLSVAYNAAGLTDKVKDLIRETYRRFPDYLFGITNYGHLCISEGHPEEVARILNGKFSIHSLYPDRRRYHMSEMAAFVTLMAHYFIAIHDYDMALTHLDMLRRLPSHSPSVRQMQAAWPGGEKGLLIDGLLALRRLGIGGKRARR